MPIPKVEFTTAKLDEVFESLHYFLNPDSNDWDWSDAIYTHYPELRQIKGQAAKVDQVKVERDFFEKVFDDYGGEMKEKRDVFQREWDTINDGIMTALEDVMECDWPQKDNIFYARVSLNPICPRYIQERAFDVFYKQDVEYMKSVVTHEVSHFLYFEKWKSLFPKTKEEELESPHLVWHLSEMVPGIILNDMRIQKVFPYEFHSYEEYENLKIDGKPILNMLQSMYYDRRSMEDFLRRAWDFVRKNGKVIQSI